jgi:hypothetical protein
MLVKSIQKISLSKNIKLMDGTIDAWATCVEEDIAAGIFNFNEFLQAVNEAIREPVYNRIDYSDFYARAKMKGDARKKNDVEAAEKKARSRS